jgi:hypothetical protein
MSNNIHRQAILTSLIPMFKKAEEEKLWFFHHSSTGEEVWCSPEFLKREQSQDKLAPEHWELRNPVGYMQGIIFEVSAKINEYNELAARLGYTETIALESHSTHPADQH